MKKNMTVVLIIALLAIVFIGGALARTKVSLEEAERAQTNPEISKCPIDYVIADLGKVKLKVPRYALQYTTLEQPRVIQDGEKNCNVTHISNLLSLTTDHRPGRGFSVGPKTKDNEGNSSKTPYDFWKSEIEEGLKKGTVTNLPDGTTKILYKGFEKYLLPKEKAPTENAEPILVNCHEPLRPLPERNLTANCTAGYIHPDGLRFSYMFWRRKVDEKDYLAFDQKMRNLYESMKVKDINSNEQQQEK